MRALAAARGIALSWAAARLAPAALALAGCGLEPLPGSGPEPSAGVRVRDLLLDLPRPPGERLTVRARTAVLEDLPGLGAGTLASVSLEASAAGVLLLGGTAERAELARDGSLVLLEARLATDRPLACRIRAQRVTLGEDGVLRAEGVRASFEVAR